MRADLFRCFYNFDCFSFTSGSGSAVFLACISSYPHRALIFLLIFRFVTPVFRKKFLCIPPQHADGYRFRIRRSCDRSDHGDRNELPSNLPLHKDMDVDRWSLHRHRFCNTGMDPSPAAWLFFWSSLRSSLLSRVCRHCPGRKRPRLKCQVNNQIL